MEAIKIKILTSKLEHYSPVDNYRELNIACEVGVGKGYFGWLEIFYDKWVYVELCFGRVGLSGHFLWVGKDGWRYILGGWG